MSLPRCLSICLCTLLGLVIMISTAQARTITASGDDLRCHVVPAHDPTPAEKAYLDGKASEAESLYREAIGKSPHDATLTAGLVRALLREAESRGRCVSCERRARPGSQLSSLAHRMG